MKKLFLLAQGFLGSEVASMLEEEERRVSVWSLDASSRWDEPTLSEALGRANPDLAIAALSRPHPGLLMSLNRIAYARSLPWTSATVEATLIEVGPTVIPGETACYECFVHRMTVNSGLTPILEARARFFDQNRDWGFRGELAGLCTTAAGLLGTEIAQLLDRHYSSARGTYMYLDVPRQISGRHRIARVPWCSTCGQIEDPIGWSAERLRAALRDLRKTIGRSEPPTS